MNQLMVNWSLLKIAIRLTYQMGGPAHQMQRKVSDKKYGVDKLAGLARRALVLMGHWKSTVNGFDQLCSLMQLKVKNQSKVLLWHNVWHGDQHLKFQFQSFIGWHD